MSEWLFELNQKVKVKNGGFEGVVDMQAKERGDGPVPKKRYLVEWCDKNHNIKQAWFYEYDLEAVE